jgi:hypothetical protein
MIGLGSMSAKKNGIRHSIKNTAVHPRRFWATRMNSITSEISFSYVFFLGYILWLYEAILVFNEYNICRPLNHVNFHRVSYKS